MRAGTTLLPAAGAIVGSLMATQLAAAQVCSTDCSTENEHWTFSNIGGGSDEVLLGMWWLGPGWGYCPVVCENNTYTFEDICYTYVNGLKLVDDTSICLGGGNDKLFFLTGPYSCGGITIQPIDANGYRLTISGGSGDDRLKLSGFDAGAYMCGNSGDDTITGCMDYQYQHGGSGNDYLDGIENYDELIGGDDHDVLYHNNSGGDFLQGGSGSDCVDIGSSFHSWSSCGSSTDYYENVSYVPSSCETQTSNCCSLSGRTCP